MSSRPPSTPRLRRSAQGERCLLVLFLTACSTNALVCDELSESLQRCGFPAADLECDTVARGDLEALAERFAERDCAAYATGERSVDPRLCALAGWACPGSPLPKPHDAKPTGALVLVSGIDDSPIFDWNPAVLTALRDDGISAYHVSVLPWATTPERAADLWLSLKSLWLRTGGGRFNLVCYAVGGLDCRYLVSPNGLFADSPAEHAEVLAKVSSVTTVATPHRGTAVADAARAALMEGTVDEVLQALAGDGTSVKVPGDARLLRTLEGLSPAALERFNVRVIDAPGLPYFSWAGISHLVGRATAATEARVMQHCGGVYLRHPDTRDALHPALWATVPFSFESRGPEGVEVTSPSDGMVSVDSAKWGTLLACVPADHYDLVGEPGHTTRDPDTGFDAVELLKLAAGELARAGL
ncbi:MAG: hypothetical protein JNK82_15475 [Myxococcaceae bacterium]|nr:hypothetical protein [Myxococcaceae bacterium]